MRTVILTLVFALYASAQCGPNATRKPIGNGQYSCVPSPDLVKKDASGSVTRNNRSQPTPMTISKLKAEVCGDSATLLLPFHGETVRCLVDMVGLARVKSECSTIHIFEPQPGRRYARVYANRKQVSLHRFLLGLESGDPRLVDHKNTNTLDCRQDNLRISDWSGNAINKSGVRRDSASGIRGVIRLNGRWLAYAIGKRIGRFSDIRDAAEAVWLRLIQVDPVAAENFLRSLPAGA